MRLLFLLLLALPLTAAADFESGVAAAGAGDYGAALRAWQPLAEKGNVGFNAANGKFEDLVKAGVIDPAKVTKTALLNASSIAGLMLTTEAMVAEVKEKEKSSGMPGGMGGGMGGMY